MLNSINKKLIIFRMNNLKKDFEELHEELNLSHHKLKRSLAYLDWCFKGVDFKNKTVLDIGGGNGIYSFYARRVN